MAVYWRGVRLDTRTRDMMAEVARRVPWYVKPTQGSYSNYSKSAGTHSGGGAIDLSVYGLDPDERETYIKWMRRVGFAAWVRYTWQGDWPMHIHAVAIGCRDLSDAAKRQVSAYYDGRDGLRANRPDYHWRPDPIPTWETYWRSASSDTPLPSAPDTSLPPAPEPEDDMPTPSDLWAWKAGEYIDEDGDKLQDQRTASDILWSAHRHAVEANRKADKALEVLTQIWQRVDEYLNSQTVDALNVARDIRANMVTKTDQVEVIVPPDTAP